MLVDNYKNQGFANRRAYLESLCEDYDRTTVYALADMLGPSEDFDGLVTSLEDYAEDYPIATDETRSYGPRA